MTTPTFIPQDPSSLAEVRYYTKYDPYYYSVDNRPLQDIVSNITTISSGGGDSARRASVLTQLNLAEVFRNLYPMNAYGFVTGLPVTIPSSNSIRVGPGALYYNDTINSGSTTQVSKQALLLTTQDFSVPAPGTSGQSISYLVQIQSTTLNSTTIPTSSLPYLDASNTFLPGLLLNGELKLGLKAGVANTTGSQSVPSADINWVPLYVVTSTYGVSTPQISFASNSPAHSKLNTTAQLTYPSTGAATSTYVVGSPLPTFPDSTTSAVNIQVPINSSSLNPYAPIKVSVVYSATATSGNASFNLNYLSLATGSSTSGALTTTTAENIPALGVANTVSTYSFTSVIPNTVFAGFTLGVWGVVAQKMFLSITRNGSVGGDTLSGDIIIHDVILSQ